MLGPGPADIADAATRETMSFGVYISEFATRGTDPDGALKEFIEICNRGPITVDIRGRVVASFGPQVIQLVTIPAVTLLAPGSAYLLARTTLTPVIPDQIFETGKDIPDITGIALLDPSGEVVDSAATTYSTPFLTGTPAAPLTPAEGAAELSLTRVDFTGSTAADFAKMPATPGRC
jgi:hypothetical protein